MLSRDDLEGLSPEFIDWLDEVEMFSSRWERLEGTFATNDLHFKMLLDWLYAAYLLGKKTQ